MRRLLLILVLFGAGVAHSAEPDDPYASALKAYRADRWDEAIQILETAISAGSEEVGYYALLGWASLRSGAPQPAQEAFEWVTTRRPDDVDALKGLGLAQQRLDDPVAARTTWRRAAALAPDDATLGAWLARLEGRVLEESRPRPATETDSIHVVARAGEAHFEVRRQGAWERLFVRGVNLGTALPGRYPAEFPDDEALYRQWFDEMRVLGANVVRLYTLHPPSLYRALRDHNQQYPNQRLWLVQGVWTELPPAHDYHDPVFDTAFRDEIRRVIDAIHGNLRLPERPGHADGIYDVDVSGDVLAWLLGREWEPYSVDAFDRRYPDRNTFSGRYISTVGSATPIEAWLASTLETAARHESEYYGSQHPVGFTSWPTLDPLIHPTEATVEEELAIRKRAGEPDDAEIKEYDNDLCQVDATRIVSTSRHRAGTYASYHAYPYYPEFMLLDPGYAEARDDEGVARYLGYLQALRRHHGNQPILVAELGVPSSRGIAHLQPEGQHHGGHDEVAQGRVNLRLMKNIHDAGLAGGILFAWVDEWFKRNWIVMNYESPVDRNRLWHNALDAEQNFGLIAARPGRDGPTIVLDGLTTDWQHVPIHQQGGKSDRLAMRITSDEGFLYVLVEIESDRSLAEPGSELWLAIDTYDAQRGSHRLPDPAGLKTTPGFEFLVQIEDRDHARILVDRPYDLFSQRNRRPYRSTDNDRGDFVEISVFTNRDRYGRDGTYYPARGYSRSPLRHGTTRAEDEQYDSLSDWFLSADGTTLELRLPWGLLNVADPSSRRVTHETTRQDDVVDTVETDGFRFQLLWLENSPRGRRRVTAIPARGSTLKGFPTYLWPGWESPTYHLRRKRSFGIVRDGWSGLNGTATDSNVDR